MRTAQSQVQVQGIGLVDGQAAQLADHVRQAIVDRAECRPAVGALEYALIVGRNVNDGRIELILVDGTVDGRSGHAGVHRATA